MIHPSWSPRESAELLAWLRRQPEYKRASDESRTGGFVRVEGGCGRIAMLWFRRWQVRPVRAQLCTGRWIEAGEYYGLLEEVMTFLRRNMIADPDVSKLAPTPESDYQSLYPALWEWMTADLFPGGERRQRSRLNLWTDGDKWTGFLRDNNTHLLCWATGDTPEQWFAVLDALLRDPKTSWREDKYRTGKSRRKGHPGT